MAVGKSKNRVDAYLKVTGQASYTDDFSFPNLLHVKLVKSTIANGVVKDIDYTKAMELPGVIKVVTCFDVPDHSFPTAGHPWSTEPKKQDIADRQLLTKRVRIYGDDIAAVIAEDKLTAERAVSLIDVEYEEYKPILSVEDALKEEAILLHEGRDSNIIVESSFKNGDGEWEDYKDREDLIRLTKTYETHAVQHCHLENAVSIAYMENDRYIVISSTQIPHIVRRVVGQALGIPWGRVRVIKPYIGGGFGNKQEVLYEPLAAFLSGQVGGRPVKIELNREENFSGTRVRHPMKIDIDALVDKDGYLIARKLDLLVNSGGYASHGHSVAGNAESYFRMLYNDKEYTSSRNRTVYTNCTTSGAMRGYGLPQMNFALECMAEDIAIKLNMDPIQFRKQNMMKEGFVDPGNGMTCHSSALEECIDKGIEMTDYYRKREEYKNQTGDVRRGIGMAIFAYKTGVYPISLETSSARMVLNQDGSVNLSIGATEIGQGADTVFAQMAAESTGISFDNINTVSFQDTDVTPFDTGAYASRQSYVTGMAVRKCGKELKKNILDFAGYMLDIDTNNFEIKNDMLINDKGEDVISVGDVAMEATYSLTNSRHITAEVSNHCKDNTFSMGTTFAEIEVDIPTGKIKVLDMVNVHDPGIVLNPKLAEAQVHGGMHMGHGWALSEELLYDELTGKMLNDNLLDYKMDTTMDTPDFRVAFIETNDPTGPFGNKSLGEPPVLPPAPAIRNALINATGVVIDELPMTPDRLIKAFKEEGLINDEGDIDV